MKKASELFHLCAYDIQYQQVGDSVNYAFLEEGSTLYIFFQGSNSITDWVRNFLFGKRPYKDMILPYRVHRGFLSAWKEVEDIIIEKVTQRVLKEPTAEEKEAGILAASVYKYDEIVIVGYSHGAALAGLCHECVWYNRWDIRYNIFGFGFEGPRFYAGYRVKKLLRERWKNFTLIRTNNDIVTHCPPTIFGYTHVGSILKVKGDTSLVEKKWLPKCVKSHYPQVVYDALVKFEEKDLD